jgi:hypothetical protein
MTNIVGSEETLKQISSQIESQFPGFIREEGPQFVAFLKAYFEYMEQEGNPVNVVRSLKDNQDIDRTVDSFVEYFRKEFMINIPSSVLADKRLLAKHIREFYRSRGSQQSYRFLFRALFGKEIEFYYPGDDILRASDGRWIRETRLRVAAPFSKSPRSFEGQQIRGVVSGATAYVQDILGTTALGLEVYDITVQNVIGTFLDGERVYNVNDVNNYATINSQVGSIINVNLKDGGAYHNIGDKVRISGGGSTEDAIGSISEVTNRGGVTIKLAKTGSGYTKESTQVIVTGGSGKNFAAAIDSWDSQTIGGLSINTDIIGNLKNARLNQTFFVRSGANTKTVNAKLTGTVTVSNTSNTVTGSGTKFQVQLQVGDLVRVSGVANTLRVHLINSNTSFVTAHTPFQNKSNANAYIGMAGANIATVLSKALRFSSTDLYAINAIALINPGYGYDLSLPTVRIVDTFISTLNLADGYGNVYGNNAVVVANNAPGTIKKITIETPGSNFGRYDEVSITNITQSNAIVYDSYTGSNTSGSALTSYTSRQKTFAGAALPIPSGVIQFPGRYIDTKGFLSWNNKLQDNEYYQEFSYVIRVDQLLNKYKEIVKSLLHPAGTKMFGDYMITGNIAAPVQQIDEAPVVARRSVRERITALDNVNSFVYYANSNFAESVSAATTQAASFLANTFAVETATATTTQSMTFIANTFATESVTSVDTPNATFLANTRITESVTPTHSQDVTYTANTFRTEVITASASHSATFIANTFASESVTSVDTPNATFIANTFASESITTTSAENATYVANTFATESVTAAHTQDVTYTANTFGIEAATSTTTQSVTFTANTFRTESVTATDTALGQKFQLIPNVYVKVLNANSTISSVSGYTVGTYQNVPISVFDDSPRLVRTGTGTSYFANGVFKANTGSIQVGGTGTNVYILTVPNSPTPSDSTYQVNAIFSNTVFTLRTNYTPTSANARIWFGS